MVDLESIGRVDEVVSVASGGSFVDFVSVSEAFLGSIVGFSECGPVHV